MTSIERHLRTIHLCCFAVVLLLSACDRVKKLAPPGWCYPPDAGSCEEGPKPFRRQLCYFDLNTVPVVDGDLDDEAWTIATWQFVDHEKAPPADEIPPPDDDEDASFEFACVADAQNLYFGFKITDDILEFGGPDDHRGSGTHNVDSFEIFLDQCRVKHRLESGADPPDAYSGDDIQMIIEAENVNATDSRELLIGPWPRKNDGIEVTDIVDDLELSVKENTDVSGWHGEIRIPGCLGKDCSMNIVPEEGRIVGVQVGYNDNDDGIARDHKLIWGTTDREDDVVDADSSYLYPARFEELMFCPAP